MGGKEHAGRGSDREVFGRERNVEAKSTDGMIVIRLLEFVYAPSLSCTGVHIDDSSPAGGADPSVRVLLFSQRTQHLRKRIWYVMSVCREFNNNEIMVKFLL